MPLSARCGDSTSRRAGRWLRRAWVVLAQSVRALFAHNGTHWAAAIAYYTLLSLVPLLLLVASLAAPFIDADQAVARLTLALGEFTPRGAERIAALLREALGERRKLGLGATAALLWTGSRVFGALTKALNLAFAAEETYGVLRRRLVEIGMLLTVGLTFALALAAEALLGVLRVALAPLPGAQDSLLGALQEASRLVLLPLAFLLIYRFAPRSRPAWRAALVGAGVATGIFLIGEDLFLDYLEFFGSYRTVYGSLAFVAVLALWAWVVAVITIFGGEVAAHVQHLAIDRRRQGPRRGRRAEPAERCQVPPPLPTLRGRRARDALLVAGGLLLGICLGRTLGGRPAEAPRRGPSTVGGRRRHTR